MPALQYPGHPVPTRKALLIPRCRRATALFAARVRPTTVYEATAARGGRTYVLVCNRAVRAEPRVDEAAGRSTLEVPTISARATSGRPVADRLRGANRRSELPSAAGERVIGFERKRPSDVRDCTGVVVVGTSVRAIRHGAGPAVIQR